jgi:hypothetical protein
MRSFPDQRAEWREHKTKLQSTKTSPLREATEILSAQMKRWPQMSAQRAAQCAQLTTKNKTVVRIP